MLKVNEIFHSIQGESTHSGRPCVFVRLTYCNLRCSYCDTEYAFYEGNDMGVDEVLAQVAGYRCRLVEITGGEPLVQAESIDLMTALLAQGYEVMLETGGSLSLEAVPAAVIKIVDFKTPSSGMVKKNLWSILDQLASHDQIKFVVGDRADFDWVNDRLGDYHLHERCTVLLSPTYGILAPDALARWILEENMQVRMQIQMHKVICDSNLRGV